MNLSDLIQARLGQLQAEPQPRTVRPRAIQTAPVVHEAPPPIKRSIGPFFTCKTPDNQELGIAFSHGGGLQLLIRGADLQKLQTVMIYPRNGAAVTDLPEHMNIKDPSDQWRWCGEARRVSGRAIRASIKRLPDQLWIPPGLHIERAAYALVGLDSAFPKQE